jgi:hypothetical protein
MNDVRSVPSRSVLAVLALLVAVSLIGAPLTMHDWSTQSHHAVVASGDEVDRQAEYQYDALSPTGQDVVRETIAEGQYRTYGDDGRVSAFSYADYGQRYVVAYEGTRYEIVTLALGGFPFVYWVMELPFVLYGLLLGLAVRRLDRGTEGYGVVTAAAVAGASFHLLGPEFDFPVLSPDGFVGLGTVAALLLGTWLARGIVPYSWVGAADGVCGSLRHGKGPRARNRFQ